MSGQQEMPILSWRRRVLSAVLPVILIVLLLATFLAFGPLGVFKSSIVPLENVMIQRVILAPEHISLEIVNDGPEQVTIAQALVNDAYWQFSIEPGATLQPLDKATVSIWYPWSAGDAEAIALLSSSGVKFEKEVEVATLTPTFDRIYIKAFILLGLYVGVIPVLLGLMWLPFLRDLKERWFRFLLSLTVGLLVFLGVDAAAESLELVASVPDVYNGVGIFLIGFLLAIMVLSAISYRTHIHAKEKGEHVRALAWGYLIALGIGFHNLGEGLAIGSAYALGEIALGSMLVIGFMVHNLTEGVAIVAPLTKVSHAVKRFFLHLMLMGIIAGGPTVIGTLIGGFSFSPTLGVLFLAIGAGAIFDVSFDILHGMARGHWKSLFTMTNVAGFLIGLLVIYGTGFLVLG